MLNHLGRGGGVRVHVDFGVRDAMRIEELLGRAAIAAPVRGVQLHCHGHILLLARCYAL